MIEVINHWLDAARLPAQGVYCFWEILQDQLPRKVWVPLFKFENIMTVTSANIYDEYRVWVRAETKRELIIDGEDIVPRQDFYPAESHEAIEELPLLRILFQPFEQGSTIRDKEWRFSCLSRSSQIKLVKAFHNTRCSRHETVVPGPTKLVLCFHLDRGSKTGRTDT